MLPAYDELVRKNEIESVCFFLKIELQHLLQTWVPVFLCCKIRNTNQVKLRFKRGCKSVSGWFLCPSLLVCIWTCLASSRHFQVSARGLCLCCKSCLISLAPVQSVIRSINPLCAEPHDHRLSIRAFVVSAVFRNNIPAAPTRLDLQETFTRQRQHHI